MTVMTTSRTAPVTSPMIPPLVERFLFFSFSSVAATAEPARIPGLTEPRIEKRKRVKGYYNEVNMDVLFSLNVEGSDDCSKQANGFFLEYSSIHCPPLLKCFRFYSNDLN